MQGDDRQDLVNRFGRHEQADITPLGGSPESDVRRRLFESGARGKFQLADPDGIWTDVTDE